VRLFAAYLRSLNPRLPRSVQTLQAGGLANAYGNGLVLPFLFIYLHNVRGIDLGTAGLIVGTNGGVGLVAGPVIGTLIDRVGGRKTLALSLLLLAVGYGLYPFVRVPWHGFAASAIAGIGNGGFWPSQSSLLAGLTTRETRSAAYGVQRAVFNLGIGVGALLGGFVATASDPGTFTVLFLLDAATFVVYAAMLAVVPSPQLAEASPEAPQGGYRDVLRDRVLLGVVALNVVFVTAGFAQFEATFPIFSRNEADVSERVIGLIFLVNVLVILVVQLPVVRLLEGRSRMAALAGMAVLWASTWLIVLAAGAWLEGAAAGALLVVAGMTFALGECVLGPAQSALVADLAPEALRGRYIALLTNSYAVGFIVGPAVGGALLAASASGLWALAAIVLLIAAVGALAMSRRMPADVRVVPSRA
jgi:MFS family permease